MASFQRHINHELSRLACPVDLDAVDLFGERAQEHWYEAYDILQPSTCRCGRPGQE